MSGLIRLYIRVEGGVQGVGFRYFTRRKAEALSLRGYVRNLPNGDVEAEVEGPTNRVSSFVDAVKQGPPGANVREVTTDSRPVEGHGPGFEIRF